MHRQIQFKTAISSVGDCIKRSPLRCGLFVIALVIALLVACFAFLPMAQSKQYIFPDVACVHCNQGPEQKFGSLSLGFQALQNSSPATEFDTAIGHGAMELTTSGSQNTATGYSALRNNVSGAGNTATGFRALENTQSSNNTGTGWKALHNNTSGHENTADGVDALLNNTTGEANVAIGWEALAKNTAGTLNTATGVNALQANTTGNNNTADGVNALAFNTTGNFNIALGFLAGYHVTTGSSNIDIGNRGVAGESRTIRIGDAGQTRTFIAGISETNIGKGVVVEVDASGQLGTRASSQRFKQEIKPMDKASEAIFALKPVMFRYKKELDPEGTPQFGLVAEEVEKVNADLVARDKEGKPYSVRYEAVNAMLLNEFLKEHHQMQDLKAIVAEQQKQIEALTRGLEKVSAQLEVSKPTPQVVKNP
jgi:trimeric autotransporter adhesin